MSNKKQIPAWAVSGHAKPTSRRDFLAHGMIPFVAGATLPSWANILFGGNAAYAANAICPPTTHSFVPFVTLNLAGGASMASNFMPMDKGGNPLASYSKIGMGAGDVPIEREFGGVPFGGMNGGALISNMLQGIRATAQKSTLDNTAFIGFCVKSRDDSDENALDITGLVAKVGVMGSKFPNIGTRNSATGISQRPATVAPPSPLVVNNFTSLANSLGFTASLNTQLNATQKGQLAKLITNLNSEQSRKLASSGSGKTLNTLLECAGIKNEGLLTQGTADVDPARNASVAPIWGLTAGQQTNSENYVFGSLVFNAIQGNAGTVSLNKGGYDYHNNTRATGNNMDLQAGQIIGRTLQTAAALGKPVAIYVTSDGSVVSTESDTDRQAPWVSDRGLAGVAYLIMFDPKGRPATSGFQVGSFTAGQSVDETFGVSADPEKTAHAVFANYLALSNKLNMYSAVSGIRGLNAGELSQVVKVA